MHRETKQYGKHFEESSFVGAPAQIVYDYIDDHSRFYSHVIKFSRILGGRMNLRLDDSGGRSVGSRIRLSGKFLGKSLSLEEVITRREPPRVKAWETVGVPKFLVVGQYQMSIRIEPSGNGSILRVAIDYDPPANSGWLRLLFSRFYMKLCAKEMVKATRGHFKS